ASTGMPAPSAYGPADGPRTAPRAPPGPRRVRPSDNRLDKAGTDIRIMDSSSLHKRTEESP
ncbi:hypothetical protein ACWGBV_36495, partial [Streptomyces sp. NPDC055051]